jgi:hypothetical protein
MATDLGSSAVSNGRVNGNTITFGGSVVFGGQTIDYTVRATITGNQLSGTVDSSQGSIPITGIKTP